MRIGKEGTLAHTYTIERKNQQENSANPHLLFLSLKPNDKQQVREGKNLGIRPRGNYINCTGREWKNKGCPILEEEKGVKGLIVHPGTYSGSRVQE